jgi:hypothetical protein
MVMLQKPRLLALGLFLSGSAYATSVNFSFDTQTIGITTIGGLSAGATAAQIQGYMNAVLSAAGCSTCSVTVLVSGTPGNAGSIGAVADQKYTGENHVVGPVSGGVLDPVTLGTTNGATSNSPPSSAFNAPGTYDTFIANTNDNSGQVSRQITLQFAGFAGKTLTINSFDYEIFPCAPGNGGCTSPPGFTFEAGNGSLGSDPTVSSFGVSGTQNGVTPSSSNAGGDGTSIKSCGGAVAPACSVGTETNAQYIGTWAPTTGITGVSELDFVDWPATIGIDNLNVSFSTPVPEPASIVLLGTLVVLLTKKLRRA